MNTYEGLFMIKPDIKEDEFKTICTGIAEAVTKHGGTIKKEEPWGKRQLAYPVKKHKEAYYYKLDFMAAPGEILKLEAAYKLNDAIMRVMVTKR